MPGLQVASVDNYSVGGPTAGLHLSTAAVGTVTFEAAPADTNLLTLFDGVTTIVYEFDNNVSVTGSNVLVDIGTAAATMATLLALIQASALTFTATDTTGGGDPQITLTHTTLGTIGDASTNVSSATHPTCVDITGGANEVDAVHVAKFRVLRGGKVTIRVENQSDDNALSISAHVAATDVLAVTSTVYKALTTAANLATFAAQSIPVHGASEVTIALQQDLDLFLRFAVTGGGRAEIQMRKHAGLEIVRI